MIHCSKAQTTLSEFQLNPNETLSYRSRDRMRNRKLLPTLSLPKNVSNPEFLANEKLSFHFPLLLPVLAQLVTLFQLSIARLSWMSLLVFFCFPFPLLTGKINKTSSGYHHHHWTTDSRRPILNAHWNLFHCSYSKPLCNRVMPVETTVQLSLPCTSVVCDRTKLAFFA